jgi:membrane-associated phospholipid phosphatase
MQPQLDDRPLKLEALQHEIARLEKKFRESTEELKNLRLHLRFAERAKAEVKAEIAEIQESWDDVHYKWWVVTLAGLLGFFLFSYFFYTNLGWHADQRTLPPGSDWLLERLPIVNLLPVLSWGWLGLHLYAGAVAILYYPRRMPFLLFLLGMFIGIRSVFVFLSPIGAPAQMLDMSQLDYLFSRIMGTYTFTNEFVFSGHTGIPFLFFLFFETRLQKSIFLAGSLVMAVSVLLTHNHYTVDVLGAYLMGYAIYTLSDRLYHQYLRPLFLLRPRLSDFKI